MSIGAWEYVVYMWLALNPSLAVLNTTPDRGSNSSHSTCQTGASGVIFSDIIVAEDGMKVVCARVKCLLPGGAQRMCTFICSGTAAFFRVQVGALDDMNAVSARNIICTLEKRMVHGRCFA